MFVYSQTLQVVFFRKLESVTSYILNQPDRLSFVFIYNKMSSPTPTDPLSEKTEMPIFDTPTPPPPKQTSTDEHPKVDIALQVLFIVLKLIMFIAGVVNVNDCPQQPMVPIYLIVAGLLGVSIKLIHGVNNKVEIKVITIMVQALIVIEFIWMIIGCYFIFSIYQPNYSPYFGRMYCERHSYLFAFALLILHCAYFVCIIVMRLTKFSSTW